MRTNTTIGESEKWSEWSDWTYFTNSPRKFYVKSTKKGVKLKWKKCAGATSYTIYASTKEKSGFKKVGTTKKTSISLKKFGKKKFKKGKKYYFYVLSNYKKDNVTYTSGGPYTASLKK